MCNATQVYFEQGYHHDGGQAVQRPLQQTFRSPTTFIGYGAILYFVSVEKFQKAFRTALTCRLCGVNQHHHRQADWTAVTGYRATTMAGPAAGLLEDSPVLMRGPPRSTVNYVPPSAQIHKKTEHQSYDHQHHSLTDNRTRRVV